MNLYVISQEHINALRAMLERGIGHSGRPLGKVRRKQMEKQIRKLEQEHNETKN